MRPTHTLNSAPGRWTTHRHTLTHVHALTGPAPGPLPSPGREPGALSPRALCFTPGSGKPWPLRAPTVSSTKRGYGSTLRGSSWETRDNICEAGTSITISQMSTLGPINIIIIKIPHHTHARSRAKRGRTGGGEMEGGGGLHPCPGSFALCASSPPCVWVISNLLGEPVCISTHLHACTQAQPRLSSNLVFVKQMFSFFKTPVPHSTVGRIPRAVREAESWRWSGVGQRGWDRGGGGQWGQGGSPVTPIPGTMCHPGAQDHCGDLQATTKETVVLCVPRASWRGLGGTGGTRRKLQEGGSRESPRPEHSKHHKGGGR